MATVFHVKGYITEDGQLKVELPEGWQPGEVEVTIAVTEKSGDEIPWEERPWTQEELDESLKFKPVPAEDIVPGGWEVSESVKDWPDSAIMVRMMRTSIWDVYQQIVKDVRS
jgi:hypothetical protein